MPATVHAQPSIIASLVEMDKEVEAEQGTDDREYEVKYSCLSAERCLCFTK